jgi:hypothetical protein
MFDRETRRSRGFGFITFKDPGVCANLLRTGIEDDTIPTPPSNLLEMRGKMIEIKVSQPKPSGHSSQSSPPVRPSSNNEPRQQQQQLQQHHQQYNHHRHHHGATQQTTPQYAPPYDHVAKFSATLQHHDQITSLHHSTNRHANNNSNNVYVYPTVADPSTPLLHLPPPSPYPYGASTIESGIADTPVTPAQAAFDMGHHMLFYSHLLATPTLMSPMMAAPMMSPMIAAGYDHQQHIEYSAYFSPYNPQQQEQAQYFHHHHPSYLYPFSNGHLRQPQAPKLDPVQECQSPAAKVKKLKAGKAFQIAGAKFFPEEQIPTSRSLLSVKPGIAGKETVRANVGVPDVAE